MICLTFFQLNSEINSVLIAVFVVFGLVIIIGSLFFSLRKYSSEQTEITALLENGEPAQAKILKVIDTGATVNKNPQVILQLEIYPSKRPSYRAEVKFYVPRLKISQIQAGNLVAVKIDRKDAVKIAVDLA